MVSRSRAPCWNRQPTRHLSRGLSCSLSWAARSALAATLAGAGPRPSSHAPTAVVGELRAVAHQCAISLPPERARRVNRDTRRPRQARSSFSLRDVMPSESSAGSIGNTLRRCRPRSSRIAACLSSRLPFGTRDVNIGHANEDADAAVGELLGPFHLVQIL